MVITTRFCQVVSAFSLAIAILGCGRTDESVPTPGGTASESEAEQIQRIGSRLDRVAPGMLNQISFTMLHCAGAESIDVFMKAVGSPDEHGKGFSFESAVRGAGGLVKYRKRVATLLTNDDEAVRGYGAQWLGMVGDEACQEDLARLLRKKPRFAKSDSLAGFGCEQAACALGMLQAREYTKDLAALLQDPNGRVRAGAATGLCLMKATEHTDAILKLLDDKSSERDPNAERACTAALVALVELGAKQHAPAIAQKLVGYGDVSDLAIYALVALDAKAQAKDIGELLKDKFKRGDAAIALALMGEIEYAEPIGDLLKLNDDEDHASVRCKAAFAVGALQAKKFIPELVTLMETTKDSNQVAAAWSLVMLECQEHAEKAIAIITQNKREECRYLWMPGQGEFLGATQFYEVEERARKSLAKLRKGIEENSTPKEG